MKSKETPYMFIYGLQSDTFDCNIVLADSNVIHYMQLRCRFNAHRNLKMFGLLATQLQIDKLNNLINNTSYEDKIIFEELKNKIIDIGF